MTFTLEGIDHIAIAVRDVEVSARWYVEVLGLERMHEDVWGSHPAMVGRGGTAVALFPVTSDKPKPRPSKNTLAMRHFAFRASGEDFEAARGALVSRGIEVEFQDHEITHSIYFHDPDGHELEITTYDINR